jgi:hypothetical protein
MLYGRDWWRHEAARHGSDWNGIMGLRASVAPLACATCGAAPCANPDFCAQCHLADQKARRRQRINGAEQRSTPQATIEAIMFCIRERGLAALKEPANVERLSRCNPTALAEIDKRVTKLRIGQ